MLDCLFYSSETITKEKEEIDKNDKWDLPEYIENGWPCLMVPLGKEDNVELQFQQNGIDYEGPRNDSYHMGIAAPPTSHIFYFETEGELKKAGHVVWESEVALEAIDKTGEGDVLNEDPELFKFIDDTFNFKIV